MPRGSLPGERRGGRQKGTPNRFTGAAKNFFREFVDANREAAEKAWAEIDDPAKKFDLWLKASEYGYPKLGRLEHVGDSGGAIHVIVKKFEKA